MANQRNTQHRSNRVGNSTRRSAASRFSEFGESFTDRFNRTMGGRGGYGMKDSPLDQEAFRVPLGQKEFLVTRRHVLYGAAGFGALVAGGAGVRAIQKVINKSSSIDVLTVSSKQVLKSDECDEIPYGDCVTLHASFTMDYGTLLFVDDDSIAACLIPTSTASPLTKVGLLFYNSAYTSIVLNQAIGTSEGFEIYDVRANRNGIIWVEANILADKWRVYTARMNDVTIASPIMVEEGDGDWETPTIAVTENAAYYQILPQLDGAQKSSDSVLKKVGFGESTAKEILISHGRFCTPPQGSTFGLTATPRTDTDTVHYQLTLLDKDTDEVLDAMVLPQSMKPLEAGYGTNGFYFSFDAIYDYGDGIANLGIYTPKQKAENGVYSGIPWFAFVRTPSAPPTWCGKYFIVKSTTAVLGFDMDKQTYFVLDVPSGSDDYGTYLATHGARDTFLTYTNVSITPILGDTVHNCQIQVWKSR